MISIGKAAGDVRVNSRLRKPQQCHFLSLKIENSSELSRLSSLSQAKFSYSKMLSSILRTSKPPCRLEVKKKSERKPENKPDKKLEQKSEKYEFLTPTNKDVVEIALAKSGNIYALQFYRLKEAKYETGSTKIRKFLEMESDLQHDSQMEHDISIEPTQMKEDRLKGLRVHIWRKRRTIWNYRCEFTGTLKRGLDLWRSDPGWYMHRVLVTDCMGRQGCCSRDCGCCFKRQFDTKRKFEANHCSIRCRCCRLTLKGYDSMELEDIEDEHMKFEPENRKNFSHEIEMVSIWGLSSNSDCNPFDLIQRVPERNGDENEEKGVPDLCEWDSDTTIR